MSQEQVEQLVVLVTQQLQAAGTLVNAQQVQNHVGQLFQQHQNAAQQQQQAAQLVQRKEKSWGHLDRYRNVQVFAGETKEYEEWSVKMRSVITAGDQKIGELMKKVEQSCPEEDLAAGRHDELLLEFIDGDPRFIAKTSAEMYNLLLNLTTGEANAVVRRSLEMGGWPGSG